MTFLVLFLLLPVFTVSASYKVFILLSYHKGDICSDLQEKGILRALAEFDGELKIKKFWLNSRHLRGAELEKNVQKAVSLIISFDPDVLITVDDAAFKVVLKNFLGRKKPAIVFSGVNRPLEEYNSEFHFMINRVPVKNVTGVHERIFARQAIEFMDDWLKRNDYKIAVVFSKDPVGLILKREFINELKGTGYLKRVVFKEVYSVSDLKRVLGEIKADSKVKIYFPFTMSVWDNEKKRFISFTEVVPVLLENIKLPDIFPNSIGAAKLGLLGGIGTDFLKMGYQAGEMAAKILSGTSIKNILIEEAKYYTLAINVKRAKECGLPLVDEIMNMADYVY